VHFRGFKLVKVVQFLSGETMGEAEGVWGGVEVHSGGVLSVNAVDEIYFAPAVVGVC